MFPTAGSQVYYNDAGEPTGWDTPSYEPPDPDEFVPYVPDTDPDEPVQLAAKLTAAEVEATAAARDADGFGVTLELTQVPWQRLAEFDNGASSVILTSADGSVFLGQVQDWDDQGNVTVELT